MRSRTKLVKNLLLGFVLLTTFSCGADPSTDSNAAELDESIDESVDTSLPSDNATASDAPVSKANFVATLISGQPFDSSLVLANQPLALWFWAPG